MSNELGSVLNERRLGLTLKVLAWRHFGEIGGDGQCKYNMEARWHNKGCNGKAVSVTGSGCVFVASVIQRKMHMRHIILSSVACPDVPYCTTLLNVKCVF